VAWWHSGWGIGLATERSQVQVLAAPLHTTLGKLFTHMCLCSPSSINWYRCKLGAKQPRVCGLAASASVWLRATEMEISTALWALVAQEGP